MLRDAAIAWVRANCSGCRFHADFVRHLDEAIALGVNCSFTIGAGMTRVNKPYLIHWFAGELFIFQLTPRQAARLGVAPKAIRYCCDHESVPDRPSVAATMSLDGLELEQPVLADLTQPIIARCRYQVTGNLPADLAFRMDFAQGANSGQRTFCLFAYPIVPLSAAGTISLEFKLDNLFPATRLNALMAVFVRCYATNKQPAINWSPISNPVVGMLELAENFQ